MICDIAGTSNSSILNNQLFIPDKNSLNNGNKNIYMITITMFRLLCVGMVFL